jgi:hypothetical protein
MSLSKSVYINGPPLPLLPFYHICLRKSIALYSFHHKLAKYHYLLKQQLSACTGQTATSTMTRKLSNPWICPRTKKQARRHWKAAQQKRQFCQEYDELKHNQASHFKPNLDEDRNSDGYKEAERSKK